MLKNYFNLITFLLITFNLGVVAQTTPELILPNVLSGTIKYASSIKPISKDELLMDELAVFVKNELEELTSNAIQGYYTKEGDYLVFKPYFPFENGMTYVVRTKIVHATLKYSYQTFKIREKKSPEQAKVLSIYPIADQLPENLLRFYIYFNTPMKRGQALTHIQLIDDNGKVDNHAFMEFKQELWSADGKRLTILFDPGRIKRGVATNLLKGPALRKHIKYQLSIAGTWQDVYGQPLSKNITKEIVIVDPYRKSINVNEWAIQKPIVNSHDRLSIRFDRILDHGLIQSMIQLVDAEENQIQGYWEMVDEERSIRFVPVTKWLKGDYLIIIASRLEDIAGNNLQNLLDHTKSDEVEDSQLYHVIKIKL